MRGANVMVWRGIAHGEETDPIVLNICDHNTERGLTALRYVEQVLRTYVVPFWEETGIPVSAR